MTHAEQMAEREYPDANDALDVIKRDWQRTAYVKGWEADKWIRVEEHQPDIDEYVLWCGDDGNCFVECIDKDDFKYPAFHWQPLPEPPKTK